MFQQDNSVYNKILNFIFCISHDSKVTEDKLQKFKNLLLKSAYTPTP